MDALLKELPIHQGLAELFEQLGTPRFWRSLVETLRLLVPADNALLALMPRERPPQVLEVFEFTRLGEADQFADYCSGMYLLDPFYQAASSGISDGLYRLETLAPDQFRQSEYYLSYFRQVVGRDELQFMLNLGEGLVLGLSLGSHTAFRNEQVGALLCVRDWVLAAMRKHLALARIEAPAAALAPTDFAAALGQLAARLTERESETARLILQGFSSKATAQRLGISPETVKVHRRNLYHKLGVGSHAELFALFLQQGGTPVRAVSLNPA
ncbi:LuxR family transcriptional regulator [Pseudomonas cavernicola]|uniref:LuxR family transcriptional regulator n=1 Tax=Pseudomonas cavernicola TaxID=2320866 RepID=A0A418XK41_9PSED|nr:LuxR C-terminal-related transcriptional regulator [Pseudomonas cavernicola]RJG12849.1 LuxR family transcriptional regulator [Pseudomonas cavernicola]